MTLPPPIAAYFAADSARDVRALTAVFAPDASVTDEGQTHTGTDAIRQWWLAAQTKYHHSAAPLQVAEDGNLSIVSARVTGDFPGSPAILRFAFGLEGGLIRSLRISA